MSHGKLIHPKDEGGDFYSTAHAQQDIDGSFEIRSDCLACGAPQQCAPTLISDLRETDGDTYFVKAPTTEHEVNDAVNAVLSCCAYALRYRGANSEIMQRLFNDERYCDQAAPKNPPDRNCDS